MVARNANEERESAQSSVAIYPVVRDPWTTTPLLGEAEPVDSTECVERVVQSLAAESAALLLLAHRAVWDVRELTEDRGDTWPRWLHQREQQLNEAVERTCTRSGLT